MCDQRLSASKIFALERELTPEEIALVINAFRHQRFLHCWPTVQGLALVYRDQRLSASKIFAPSYASVIVHPDE